MQTADCFRIHFQLRLFSSSHYRAGRGGEPVEQWCYWAHESVVLANKWSKFSQKHEKFLIGIHPVR